MDIQFRTQDILRVSYKSLSANNMARAHSHPSYELYYLVSGSRYLFVSDRLYEAKEGDAFLVAPGIPHRTLDAGSGAYTRLTLNIPLSVIPRCDGLPLKVHLCRPEGWRADRMRELSEIARGADPIRVFAAAMEMLSTLLSLPHVESLAPASSPSLSRIAGIVGYIDANFTSDLTVTSISEKFFISEYYLCRLFKQYTGRTIHGYITELRLSLCEGLLSEGLEVDRVWRESGFGSASAFRCAYRKHFGIPPRSARRVGKRLG